MFDINALQPLALKVWALKKYEEWEKSLAYTWGKEATDLLKELIDNAPDSSQRWPSAVEERLSYLMARAPVIKQPKPSAVLATTPTIDPALPKASIKPIVVGQDELDALNPAIREAAAQYLCTGHALWLAQGDGDDKTVIPKPELMNDVLVLYEDKKKTKPICYVRKIVEVEIDNQTGAQTDYTQYEVYVGTKKYLFDNARPELDTITDLKETPNWIEIGAEGNKSCYATVRSILIALNKVFLHQDATVQANTKPLVEIKGYQGTDPAEAREAVEKAAVILTDGAGGVNVHSRTMDSASIELWTAKLLQQFYQGTGTVGKEKELEFAVSGKALDRLFVQAENKAVELGNVLEPAVKAILKLQGVQADVDIIWNTDRPVDDTGVISVISSDTLLSKRTKLEQHPWVDDVDVELKRIEQESTTGMPTLFGDNDNI